MLYKVLIPAPVLMIPILVMTTKGTHAPKNHSLPSDVIVTYSNHAEASREDKVVLSNTTSPTTDKPQVFKDNKSDEFVNKQVKEKKQKESDENPEPQQEDVLFIPNEKVEEEPIRNEFYLQKDRASIGDLMGGHKTVEELLASKDVRLETESPVSDIIFVLGKNKDGTEPEKKEKDKRQKEVFKLATTKPPTLDCTNLNCHNTIKSICGERMEENNQRKFRLFMNDCYFRKVNCNFQNPSNRYKVTSLNNCNNVAAHTQAPFSFISKRARKSDVKPAQYNNTRKTTSSRRSMTMDATGQFCSHPCPVSCPGHYEPECAVSSTGRHRVFMNHCALDHNSCSFGIVWHSVPLTECVGDKKAELRQSAGFVGWMQRVGIVDKKGRLVYEM